MHGTEHKVNLCTQHHCHSSIHIHMSVLEWRTDINMDMHDNITN